MDVVALQAAKADAAKKYAAFSGPALYKPAGLRRWRAAFGDALNAITNVMVLGHSITQGVGSDGSGAAVESASYITGAWARQLGRLFAATYGDAGEGWIHPGDYRWTYAGTTTVRDDFAPLRRARQIAAGAGNTATITLPLGTTEFDVLFYDNNTQMGVAVDGGAVTTYTLGNTAAMGKRTITGLAAGTTHSVVISNPGAANLYLSGVVCRKQTTGVLVHRIGLAGADTGYATGLTATGFVNGNTYTPLAAGVITNLMAATYQMSPPLTILEFATNEFGQQATSGITPTSYASNMQRLITEATSRGGCVLILHGPSSVAQSLTYSEQQYWDAAKALADSQDHVAVLNIADLWGAQAKAQTDGLSISSSVHPNRRGHGDIARLLHRVLTAPGLG